MNTEPQPSAARESLDRLSSRLAREKQELVLFLIELADFDRNKQALALGYPSTLGCLVGELGLTESSACRRISAARMLARFPTIAPYLIANRLTLMGLIVLKDVLDESNVDDLLERAAGLSEPAVRDLVMRLRLDAARPPAAPAEVATGTAATVEVMEPESEAEGAQPGGQPHRVLVPTPERDEPSALKLWVGREFREELAVVRDLLSHAVPRGKTEEVLLYALRAVRKLHERKKYGAKKRNAAAPVKGPPAAPVPHDGERKLPVEVRRETDQRDGRSCAFVGAEGRRCGSTWQLEYHHIDPHARGGQPTTGNITEFCRAHNLLQAERDFGAETIAARIAEAREPSPHAKDAISALTNLGFKKRPAEAAVALAASRLPPDGDVVALIRESARLLARPNHSSPP